MNKKYYGYIDNKGVYIPDTELKPNANHIYKPVQGYAYTLAVFENKECIGWLDVHELGYNSVKNWVNAGSINPMVEF